MSISDQTPPKVAVAGWGAWNKAVVKAFPALAESLMGSGKAAIVFSETALVKQQTLIAHAEAGGDREVVASGAIMELNAVRALLRDGITDC